MPMRILWYSWKDIRNPDAGPQEAFTHEVCKRLTNKDGIGSITIFASRFPGCEKQEIVDGIRIVRDCNNHETYRTKASQFYRQRNDEFDLVVDSINNTIVNPVDTPSFVKDKPVIAVIHGLARDLWFYRTRFPMNIIGYFFFEKYWLRNYRGMPTITVSNSMKEDLVDLGFKQVFTVPVGIEFQTLPGLPDKEKLPTVLFVDTLGQGKADDAIRAFKIIRDEIPDARLWVVGNGYMMKELKNLRNILFRDVQTKSRHEQYSPTREPTDIAIFFETASGAEISKLMSRAHVLLVPGVREGWSSLIAQANAVGTPAVAYDVPGVRDSVLDGYTGNLVQSGDPVAMAIEAVQLLKDEKKRKFLSTNALHHSNQFDWDQTAARVHDVMIHSSSKAPDKQGKSRLKVQTQ